MSALRHRKDLDRCCDILGLYVGLDGGGNDVAS